MNGNSGKSNVIVKRDNYYQTPPPKKFLSERTITPKKIFLRRKADSLGTALSMTNNVYGQYVLLSDPEPSMVMVKEARRFLVDGARATEKRLGKKAKNFRFIQCNNYEMRDPDTGEVILASTVEWKAEME